ncbi:MAG: O-antigen ligase family protein, partial [Caldilineaceae bacterium]
TYIRLSDVLVNEHGLPSLYKIFVPLLGGVILWRWLFHRETPNGWQRPLLWMAGYILVGCSALLYARDQALAIEGVETLLKDVTVGLLIVILLQRATQLRHVVWSLIGAGIFLGTITVYQQLTGAYTNNFGGFAQATVEHIVGDLNQFRTAGPLTPNFYALILVALVPLALDRFWHERQLLLRLVAGWGAAVAMLSIILTFSRGGFLAMGLVLGLLVLRYRPRPMTLAVTALLFFALLLLAPASYQERMLTLLDSLPLISQSEVLDEASFRGRLSEVTVAVQMFADHPVAGVGYDNFDVHYLNYSQYLGLDTRREERQAHSLYLEIAAETGLAGILTFLLLLSGLYFSVRQARTLFRLAGQEEQLYLVDALAIGMIGYLAGSTFLHAAFPRYFWLLAAILLALPRVAATELAMVRSQDIPSHTQGRQR